MSYFRGEDSETNGRGVTAGAGAGREVPVIPKEMQLDTTSLLRFPALHERTAVVERVLKLVKDRGALPDFLRHKNMPVSDEFVEECEKHRSAVFYQNIMDMARLLDRCHPLEERPGLSKLYARTDVTGKLKRENVVLAEYQKIYPVLSGEAPIGDVLGDEVASVEGSGKKKEKKTLASLLLSEVYHEATRLDSNAKIDKDFKLNFIQSMRALEPAFSACDVMLILEGYPDAFEVEKVGQASFPSTPDVMSRHVDDEMKVDPGPGVSFSGSPVPSSPLPTGPTTYKYSVEYPAATGDLHAAWCDKGALESDISAISEILISYQSHPLNHNQFIKAAQELRQSVVEQINLVINGTILPALNSKLMHPYQIRQIIYYMVQRLKRTVFETVNMPGMIANQLSSTKGASVSVTEADMNEIGPGRLYDRDLKVLGLVVTERTSYLVSLEQLCKLPENMLFSCMDLLRAHHYVQKGATASLIQSSFIRKAIDSLLELHEKANRVSPAKPSGTGLELGYSSYSYSFDSILSVMKLLLEKQVACLDSPKKFIRNYNGDDDYYYRYNDDALEVIPAGFTPITLTPQNFNDHGEAMKSALMHSAFGVARLLPRGLCDQGAKILAQVMSATDWSYDSASKLSIRVSESGERVSARPLGDLRIVSLVAATPEGRGARSPQPDLVRPKSPSSPPYPSSSSSPAVGLQPPQRPSSVITAGLALPGLSNDSDSDSDDSSSPLPSPVAAASTVPPYPPLSPTSALDEPGATSTGEVNGSTGLEATSLAFGKREQHLPSNGSSTSGTPVRA